MNEKKKTASKSPTSAEAPRAAYMLPGFTPVRCALFGTQVCMHPECTGYDNRLCDDWRNHSGR